MRKVAQNYVGIIFRHSTEVGTVHMLVWCISWHGPKKNCPAYFYRVLPCNFRECSVYNLLHSLTATVIEAFEVFCHLGK